MAGSSSKQEHRTLRGAALVAMQDSTRGYTVTYHKHACAMHTLVQCRRRSLLISCDRTKESNFGFVVRLVLAQHGCLGAAMPVSWN
jgi:hypothetical protein